MFRLIAILALLVFCWLPVSAQQIQRETQFLNFSGVYPGLSRIALPPFPQCAGFPQVTVDSDGLNYVFNLNLEGGLVLYVFSTSADGSIARSLKLTERCGGVESFILNIRVPAVGCKTCGRGKFYFKSKAVVLGVRG